MIQLKVSEFSWRLVKPVGASLAALLANPKPLKEIGAQRKEHILSEAACQLVGYEPEWPLRP